MIRYTQLHWYVLESWQDFFDWYYTVTNEDYKYNNHHIEGFVIEDANGYMVNAVAQAEQMVEAQYLHDLKVQESGLEEGKDFFLIKDCCLTELNPEEVDENGVGRTLTCIGFRPLPDELAHQISRKYQLYR